MHNIHLAALTHTYTRTLYVHVVVDFDFVIYLLSL